MAEPCTPHCPAGDCAGCVFPPAAAFEHLAETLCRRPMRMPTSDEMRQLQLRAFERQRRQERAFAFEPQLLEFA